MEPMVNELIPAFLDQHKDVLLTYSGIGSNAGIQSLLADEADLVVLSRIPTGQEMQQLQKKGPIELREIGYDGITIISNRSNPTYQLTMQQLKDIFSGKITSWDFNGHVAEPILVYTRDANSGTYSFFKNHVLDTFDYSLTSKRTATNEEIVLGVKNNSAAIGYIGLNFNNGDVKTISLSDDGGENFYDNTRQNIRNHHYPLTRPLYIAYYKNKQATVRPFVEFIFSDKGQSIIDNSGFLSINR